MFSGSNLPRVGTYNINVVLSSVQAADGISRVEIAQQTGLTAQTVSVIVRRLIEQGIVIESGSLASTGGKPRTTLRINPTAAYAIGIHFDPIEVSVVVVDMKGQQLVHSRHVSPRLEPEALIARAATVARKHLADLGIADERVLGSRSYVRLLAVGSNPADYAADSEPDDYTPRDRWGHGSAVASVAAGNAVTAPAVSSTGGTVTLQGMAPKAWIGNYKIAGSFGFASDESMIDAVDDAVTDGMDVITTSWGSNALGPASSDPVASAYENAVLAGKVVLAAAGDGGFDGLLYYPAFNTISSPSNAPDVISVGATLNSHGMMPAVSVNASGAPSNLQHIQAMMSDSYFYPSMDGANAAPLVDVDLLDGTGLACVPLAAGSLNGAFALIQVTASCPVANSNANGVYDQQALNAQNAGAIGFVWYQSNSTSIYSTPYAEGIYETGPGVVISNSDGLNLKAYIDANPGAAVTIDAAGAEMDLTTYSSYFGFSPSITANMLASYSSFGPTPDGQLKPDLLATGGDDPDISPDPNDTYLPSTVGMYMAGETFDPGDGILYTANGFVAADGTSFSAPLTAGAAALMKQAYPSLNGQQIKSLLVNNAAQTVTVEDYYGMPVDAEWIGAGLLNAGTAIAANVTAVPSSASFGTVSSPPPPIVITLTNIGSGSVTLASSVSCCSVNTGGGIVSTGVNLGATKITPSLSSSTLTAGGTATLTVTFSGPLPVGGEYSGAVILTGSATTLRIPFMFIVKSNEGYNVVTFLSCCDSNGNYYFQGTPGSDVNPSGYPILQVTDTTGAGIANASVPITATGGLTLKSAPGGPACKLTSTTSITCPTDAYGFLYFDAVLPASTTTSYLIINMNSLVETSIDVYAYLVTTTPTLATGGVVDNAAYLPTIAPGSYVTLFGSNLTDYTASNTFNNLALQLDTVTVSFDVGNGVTYPGYPVYISPGQVNVFAPWELQGYSSAQVKVTSDTGYSSNVVTVSIANSSPAFFGDAAAIATDLSYNLITTSNAAKRGSTILLWMNGLGPVTNQPYSGVPAVASPLSSTTTTPAVTIGGQKATVVYAVLAPGTPGEFQVAVTVPANATTGSAVPISLSVGGKTTEAATLPVQ
ncbi:MAG: S8 family serine peptidase [Bryobacteraceae bacterium]